MVLTGLPLAARIELRSISQYISADTPSSNNIIQVSEISFNAQQNISKQIFSSCSGPLSAKPVPLLENLKLEAEARLTSGCQELHHVLQLFYIDEDGNQVELENDDTLQQALEQFPNETLTVLVNFVPPQVDFRTTTIKLCLAGPDPRFRKVPLSSLLNDIRKIDETSLKKLYDYARELHQGILDVALVVMGSSTPEIIGDPIVYQHDVLESHCQLARILEGSKDPILKIWVQTKVSQVLRLVWKGGEKLFLGNVMVDVATDQVSFSKLEALAQSTFVNSTFADSSSRMIELSICSPTGTHHTLADSDGLQKAMVSFAKDDEIVVFCQAGKRKEANCSPRGSFIWMYLLPVVLAVLILFVMMPKSKWSRSEAGSNLIVNQESFFKMKTMEYTSPLPDKQTSKEEEARHFQVLLPRNAKVRGRHAQVRAQQVILFYHKSNWAMWKLGKLHPGRYAAKARLARKGPRSTTLYIGIATAQDEEELLAKSARDHRELLRPVDVQPTGSWDSFRFQSLGVLELMGTEESNFLVMAARDDKPVGVDFQEIYLTLVEPWH